MAPLLESLGTEEAMEVDVSRGVAWRWGLRAEIIAGGIFDSGFGMIRIFAHL